MKKEDEKKTAADVAANGEEGLVQSNNKKDCEYIKLSTDVNEFKRFHELLMQEAPEGYRPHYLHCLANMKDPDKNFGKWQPRIVSFETACDWMKKGGNIGIAGMRDDPLINIDIDDENTTDYKTLKTTLTCRSASRKGVHLFYFEENPGEIENVKGKSAAGEIRARNQYVIAPGSFVVYSAEKAEAKKIDRLDKSVGTNTIEVAIPTAKITVDELPPVFKAAMEKEKKDEEEAKERADKRVIHKNIDLDGAKKSAFFSLTIADLGIVDCSLGPSERFPSPFHGSTSGTNTSISADKELIFCWPCGVTLNAQQACATLGGAGTDEEMGSNFKSKLSSYTGNDNALFLAWKYAKENSLIPKSDKIPRRAMRSIAIAEKFCETVDIDEDGKLPDNAYNNVLDYLQDEKIKSGRKKIPKPSKRELMVKDTKEILEVLHERYEFVAAEDTHALYYYKDGVYEDAEILIRKEVERLFNDKNSTYFTNEITNHLLRETYMPREAFNTDLSRIPLNNGLFNLETFELEPFDKSMIYTFRIPITYNAEAKCPNLEAWIREIVEDDSVNLLQEYCGYGFEPRLPLHKTLWLHGTGRNGKGAFMRLYLKAIGKQNRSSLPLEQMTAKFRFSLIRLFNKFVNVSSEPQSNYVYRTETFKKITGGDEIEAEIKSITKTISFTSFAKMFVMGNKYPMIDDDTVGFWERMEIVKFPNDYSDSFTPDIEDRKIEKDGGEEIALAGFFNWCMKGLKRLKTNNYKLSASKSSVETRQEFQKVSNSIRAFIVDNIILKPSAKTVAQPDLWSKYIEYCDDYGLEVQPKGTFTGKIGELRGVLLKPVKIDKHTKKIWIGLGYNEAKTEGENEDDEKGDKEESGQSDLIKKDEGETGEKEEEKDKKVTKVNEVDESNLPRTRTNIIIDDKDIKNNGVYRGEIEKGNFDNLCNPEEKPTKNVNIDLVCECGGTFENKESLNEHRKNCEAFHKKQTKEARKK